MLNIKLMLKVKSLKEKTIYFIGKLLKPLEYIEKLIRAYNHKRYKKMEARVSKWTDEYAIKLYSKALIKHFIELMKFNCTEERFVVAEWCDTNAGLDTICDYITNQNFNESLRHWGYKLPNFDVKRIEKLTDLLKIELEKYNEIKCRYTTDEEDRHYKWYSKNYVKTLVVEFVDIKGDK